MPSGTEFLLHSAFITYASALYLIATSSITHLLLLPMLLTSLLFLLLLPLIVLTNYHTLFRHAPPPRKLISKLVISFFRSLYFKEMEMVISAAGRNWSLVSLYYTVVFYLSAATLYAVSADVSCFLVLVVVYLAVKMIHNFDDGPQAYIYGYDTDDEFDDKCDDDDCENDDAGSNRSNSHGELEERRNSSTDSGGWVHVTDPRENWDRFID